MRGIFREGFAFLYCKDGIVPLDIISLDDPTKFSSYVSKCMTVAGFYKRVVIYLKICEEFVKLLPGQRVLSMGSRSDGSQIDGSDHDLLSISDRMKVIVKMRNFTSRGDCFLFLADLSYSPPGFAILRSSIDLSYFPSSSVYNQNKFVRHGPSIQISTEKSSVLSDYVFAIQCSNWPPGEKGRWLNRYRPFGWPPKHVVEDLLQTVCVVVPVGREDSELSHLEWRFAFPLVERGLVLSFNKIQLQCFVLLKILNNSFLKKIDNINDDGINTFHLKMVMFWECENSDPNDWCEGNLFECVRRCLRKLRLSIEQKELKHFIIEKRNVLVTKLKNSETREKVLKTIEMMENDISGSVIKCVLSGENVSLLFGMVCYKFILDKSQTSLGLDQMVFNRLAWSDKTFLIESLIVNGWYKLSHLSLSELYVIRKNISSKTDILLSWIKKEINSKSIPNHTMSRFIKDIYLIGNGNICHKETENILLQISRVLIGTIDIQIGSRLFEKAFKIHGVLKNEILSEAEHFFKKGVKMDGLAGQLYLATFYIACGNDESEKIITSMFKQNGTLVYLYNGYMIHDAILISDGNIELTCGIFHEYRHSGYAMSMTFHNHDLQLVPDVLKYEVCMLGEGNTLPLHPFVYTKYLQILLGIKSKSSLVTQYIQELRQILNQKFYDTFVVDRFQYFNLLAYCYRQIGHINKAIYLYMSSMRCFSKDENCAVFHLAFLLN